MTEKDRTVERTHVHVSQGSYDTTVVLGLKLAWCLPGGSAQGRLGKGVLGKGYTEISQGCVPCSKQIPERVSRYMPMRGVASIIGRSLISLRNPETGPERVAEKTEKFRPTLPPVFLAFYLFLILATSTERTRPPSLPEVPK